GIRDSSVTGVQTCALPISLSTSIPCASSFNVGGQTFSSEGTGEQRPFSTAFAEGCGTAFAQLSERLTATEWTQMVKEFGIGADRSEERRVGKEWRGGRARW